MNRLQHVTCMHVVMIRVAIVGVALLNVHQHGLQHSRWDLKKEREGGIYRIC